MEAASMGAPDPVREITKLWWVPLISGIFWMIIALVVLRFDATSVSTVGILAGVIFISAGVSDLVMSTIVDEFKWLYIALGVALCIVGLAALMTPQNTFEALAAVTGWFLLFKGIFDIVIALANRRAELWWLTLALGILEIGLAFWAAGYFGRKAFLLIVFVALSAMTRGITQLVLAFQLREVNKEL